MIITAAARKIGHRAPQGVKELFRSAGEFLAPPDYPGARLTPKRLLNLYRVRYEQARGRTTLNGYPLVLTIEATNACNLRCPYCFTGAGEAGRDKSMLQLPLYQKVLDELGDRVFRVEFYNWGEPLLNKNIYDMIHAASSRGISTLISTNLSIPYDDERAEKLVRSGLSILGVSIDGATQESYEKYRVKGNLDLIIRNIRLINDAKRRLGSKTPRLSWGYHVFPHNTHEIETARAMATELDMSFDVSKGWVAGPEWDPENEYKFFLEARPRRCMFLWQRAVIQNDGAVAPCCGTFYQEDDFGHVGGEPSVPLSAMATTSFRDVWNNDRFREARAMFGARRGALARAQELICYECPVTVMWERYEGHIASGLPKAAFKPQFTTNDGFNFFFERKPARAGKARNGAAPEEAIPLVTPTPFAAEATAAAGEPAAQ